ncbi:hypothetical protein V9T40_004626 [Parthenolecanium corni]|uniref:Uncharacterized protein n=1 Tax=Parthenolecanium corni TaxID=536013 RepID=A0AAN9TCC3_9HEMI
MPEKMHGEKTRGALIVIPIDAPALLVDRRKAELHPPPAPRPRQHLNHVLGAASPSRPSIDAHTTSERSPRRAAPRSSAPPRRRRSRAEFLNEYRILYSLLGFSRYFSY